MNKIAKASGILYLIIIIGGIFAEAFVRSRLFDYNDALVTALSIRESEFLFRLGFSSELFVFICDAAVTVLIYILLRPVNKHLALFAFAFRLITVSILGANLLLSFFPIMLLSNSDYLAAFNPEQLNALSLFYIKAHGLGYSLALVFFSIHCALIGYIITISTLIPKALGILLIIAGLCYFAYGYTSFLFPELSSKLFPIILLPCLIAELFLSLWLCIKGVNELD